MASDTKRSATVDAEHVQMFPNWVYQIPGLLLIILGFGGILFLSSF